MSKDEEEKRVIVKGYLRPDGSSYYIVIPKDVREVLELKGGEYFIMKVKPEKKKIGLKIVDFPDDEMDE